MSCIDELRLFRVTRVKTVGKAQHGGPCNLAQSFPRVGVIEGAFHHVDSALVGHIQCALHGIDLNFASALKVVQAHKARGNAAAGSERAVVA